MGDLRAARIDVQARGRGGGGEASAAFRGVAGESHRDGGLDAFAADQAGRRGGPISSDFNPILIRFNPT